MRIIYLKLILVHSNKMLLKIRQFFANLISKLKNTNKYDLNLEFLFLYLGFFYVLTFFVSTTLVIFSIFNLIPFYILFIIFLLGLIYLFASSKIKIDVTDLIAFIVLVCFGLLSFIFFHHTLYGVRDEGVYANSAIGIITRGSIYIKEFINFPIWVKQGNVFIPPFLFGTSAWIALYYALFELKGVYMINIIPILIGGLSYYYIAKAYIKNKAIHLLFCFF